MKHVWNPEDLAGRPNTWNPVRQKPLEDTDKMSVRPRGRIVVVLAPAKLRRPLASVWPPVELHSST